ncbi:hypothetical protein TRFO_01137 [Tritrichomonas foetus]|uniref:Uncharacterized protein n=1 Tax=Tritrichomonas foetus TaxID=1144522 RepID=A0A1J4KJD2_9EUKA|nr:hypothetical protein TRFO_01137 [Tritrichomonas foetus]|eukprot:OHT11202.1 hypothetical protein TRFO_01137 [Tritrichomonas foetus]
MSSSDSDFTQFDVIETPEVPKSQILDPSLTKGQLVYLFNHPEDQAELAVFRKICMKYGLQAWSQMLIYLPWRTRASLRTTLCRILKKQALSEYGGIRADPFEIQKGNCNLREGEANGDYKMKAGMLVNLKWNRSREDLNKIQEENARKYEIPEKEANEIEIPIIISLEFMRQQLEHRRNSVLLYRAAILNEMKNRNLPTETDNLMVDELMIIPSGKLCLPQTALVCKVDYRNRYFEVDNTTDDI